MDDLVKRLHNTAWGDRELREEAADEIERLTVENATLQATIDRLMLEYCPDETTTKQLAEWGKHQRLVAQPSEKEIT